MMSVTSDAAPSLGEDGLDETYAADPDSGSSPKPGRSISGEIKHRFISGGK